MSVTYIFFSIKWKSESVCSSRLGREELAPSSKTFLYLFISFEVILFNFKIAKSSHFNFDLVVIILKLWQNVRSKLEFWYFKWITPQWAVCLIQYFFYKIALIPHVNNSLTTRQFKYLTSTPDKLRVHKNKRFLWFCNSWDKFRDKTQYKTISNW